MIENPLRSLHDYSYFVADMFDRPEVERSTVRVWSDSPYTGISEGEVFFTGGFRLRLREELDFDAGLITSYGYEVYRNEERLYWYDDFPHPDDPTPSHDFSSSQTHTARYQAPSHSGAGNEFFPPEPCLSNSRNRKVIARVISPPFIISPTQNSP